MTHYLVVAHQTATSATLLARASNLAARSTDARFTLLIPATHPTHLFARDGALFTWSEEDAERIALNRAADAQAAFERAGLRVVRTAIGDGLPFDAIKDELRARPRAYDEIILSTLPPGTSRWLAMDVQHQAEQCGLPVVHVYEGMTEASARTLLQHRTLPSRLRGLFAPVRAILETTTPPLAVLVLAMTFYFMLAAMLALRVDLRFLANGAIALVVFATLLGGLLILERTRRT